jgi:insertion element IS1 protein InsB
MIVIQTGLLTGNAGIVMLPRSSACLSAWGILLDCTDELAAYGKEITQPLHIVSKSQTVGIERNNARHRHWVPPFRRRSCIISKSKERLNAAIALFAAIHVNKTWNPQVSLFG